METKAKLIPILTGAMLALSSVNVSAEILLNPAAKTAAGGLDVTGAFISHSTDYEVDGGGEFDVDRTVLGISAAHGLSDKLDIYGSLGLSADVEYENSDGDGFILAGGVRGGLPVNAGVDLGGYAQLTLFEEDVDSIDVSGWDVRVGVLARGAEQTGKFSFYGGLELIVLDDFEADTNGGSSDFEYDDIVGLRLGAQLNGDLPLHLQLGLMHESSIMLSASTTF
jgi:hypothetical protein